MIASLPRGTKMGVGDSATVNLHTKDGRAFSEVLTGIDNPSRFTPTWEITKGDGVVSVSDDGTITAIAPGDATVEAKIPGLAARNGFLFIKALGQVGFYADGAVNWDIAILVGGFGLTLFVSQLLSGMGMPANPQQATANKITPVMITGMFLFFPLPAGVLLYMVIANIFQGLQMFILTREALPENLQKILDQQMAQQAVTVTATSAGTSESRLPLRTERRQMSECLEPVSLQELRVLGGPRHWTVDTHLEQISTLTPVRGSYRLNIEATFWLWTVSWRRRHPVL